MSFKVFLSSRKAAYDAKGDFSRLAMHDTNFPDGSSWEVIREYIVRHYDNHRITEAGEELWKEFQKARRKARIA